MRNKKTAGIAVIAAAAVIANHRRHRGVHDDAGDARRRSLQAFAALLQEQNYEEMYAHLSENAPRILEPGGVHHA